MQYNNIHNNSSSIIALSHTINDIIYIYIYIYTYINVFDIYIHIRTRCSAFTHRYIYI